MYFLMRNNKMKNDYYVYLHKTLDGDIFYVGKGRKYLRLGFCVKLSFRIEATFSGGKGDSSPSCLLLFCDVFLDEE
jgi:hypothetical protein